MKTLISLLVLLLALALHEEASAYRNDVVNITETNYDNIPKNIYNYKDLYARQSKGKKQDEPPPSTDNKKEKNKKDESPEATRIAAEAAKAMKNALLKEFPCLIVFTTSNIKDKLAELKRREFVGPAGEKWIKNAKKKDLDERQTYTTAEEEETFQKTLQEQMDTLKLLGEAKYYISVTASAKNIVNIQVSALSRFWEKRIGYFYKENKIYPDVAAALADVKRIADELVDALVENGANEPVKNNEVCPFTGKVEVKAIAKRKQQKEDTYVDYCNGADHQGRKTEILTGDREESWQFERVGNPDTNGTMQGTMAEKIVREEVTGCHECASGRRGEWMFTDTTELAASASDLDISTWTMATGKSDNKDATIRLHFFKNGTYKVGVRAVSKESTKYVTRTTTAVGTCDNLNQKPKTDKQPVTFPLEQQFGPFSGTVRDTRLKGKQVVDVAKDGSEEVTEYTIEFDLKRPEKK